MGELYLLGTYLATFLSICFLPGEKVEVQGITWTPGTGSKVSFQARLSGCLKKTPPLTRPS